MRIQFFIQSKKNPAGIYVRLKEGREIDAKAKTKFVIDIDDWSKAKQYLKHTKDEKLKLLDKELQDLKTKIIAEYNSSVSIKPINTTWLKGIIEPVKQNVIPLNLVEYFEFYSEKHKSRLSTSSIKKLSVVKNFIILMEKVLKKRFPICEINEDFLNEYLSEGLRLNYSQNYLARNFKFVKTVCYDAEGRGVKINPMLRRLNIKETKTRIVYLDNDEIDTIEKLILKRPALANARDWLVISCETAQRVSDLLRFNTKDIIYQKNKEGQSIPFLSITQKKTGTPLSIPISTRVMNIIERNGGEFPRRISDQRYNEYIKQIAKEAGLTQLVDGAKQDPKSKRKVLGKFHKWELVTSHIGRRSFATNKFGKIRTPLIMAMTGHKSEREFLKYIGKSDLELAIELSEYIN